MTESEFSFMYSYMCEAYNKEINENQMLIWYDFFKSYDINTFKSAVIQCINESKFFPAIADIKQIIVKQTNEDVNLKADEEWEKVLESVRQYGYYQEDKALASLEPITRGIVKRIGFSEICLADESRKYNLRSAFIKSFDSEKEDLIRYNSSVNKDSAEMLLIQNRNKELLSRIVNNAIKRID